MKKLNTYLLLVLTVIAGACVPNPPTASIYDTAYAGGPVLDTPEDGAVIELTTGPEAKNDSIRFAWDQEWDLNIRYYFEFSTDSNFSDEEIPIHKWNFGREVMVPHSEFSPGKTYYWRGSRRKNDSDEGGSNGLKEIWNERSFFTE